MIRQRWKLAVLATIGLTAQLGIAAPAAAAGPDTPAAQMVTRWNELAVRTVATENATPAPISGVYFGFVSLAVYDAVVAIRGGYQPYRPQPHTDHRASTEAAVATAAYRVLDHYFPGSAANLATDYAAALATVPDGRRKDAGTRAGAFAADQIIRSRANDGWGAPITLNVTPAPGVWRPTADNPAPMVAPWLGFVRPLAVRSPTQFRPPGPDPLRSRAYARDFAEIKAYGPATGSARTPLQTETALFWSANVLVQYQAMLRDQVTRRGLNAVRSARAFALLNTSIGDAQIGCWRAKYDDAFWRPITAIRLADTDGNAATAPDPAWTPLVQTPPYPDYVSGHACVTGAATETVRSLFGARGLGLTVSSSVTATTRHYESTAVLDAETMNARIWLGIHFRKAMTDGNRLGHRTAQYVQRHYFRPC